MYQAINPNHLNLVEGNCTFKGSHFITPVFSAVFSIAPGLIPKSSPQSPLKVETFPSQFGYPNMSLARSP